jgi:hypothetical protein
MRRGLDHSVVAVRLLVAAAVLVGCGSSGAGSGNSSTVTPMTIGPAGGTFDDGRGIKVTVPRGALSGNVQISGAHTNAAAASGYGAVSSLYDFEPAGVTFSQPVTITLPLPSGSPPNVTIYWSEKNSPSVYDDVNGAVSGSSISAQVTHFSTGFIGTLVSMSGWVHVAHPYWIYWKPTTQWIGTESTSGIDISSPTGDADVSFAFVYGPLVPTTVDQAEAVVEQIFTGFAVVSQSAVSVGPYGGPSRTTEFTAVWNETHDAVHGKFTVDLGYQTFDAHLTMANTALWPTINATLQLIADHITYCAGGTCGQ